MLQKNPNTTLHTTLDNGITCSKRIPTPPSTSPSTGESHAPKESQHHPRHHPRRGESHPRRHPQHHPRHHPRWNSRLHAHACTYESCFRSHATRYAPTVDARFRCSTSRSQNACDLNQIMGATHIAVTVCGENWAWGHTTTAPPRSKQHNHACQDDEDQPLPAFHGLHDCFSCKDASKVATRFSSSSILRCNIGTPETSPNCGGAGFAC